MVGVGVHDFLASSSFWSGDPSSCMTRILGINTLVLFAFLGILYPSIDFLMYTFYLGCHSDVPFLFLDHVTSGYLGASLEEPTMGPLSISFSISYSISL